MNQLIVTFAILSLVYAVPYGHWQGYSHGAGLAVPVAHAADISYASVDHEALVGPVAEHSAIVGPTAEHSDVVGPNAGHTAVVGPSSGQKSVVGPSVGHNAIVGPSVGPTSVIGPAVGHSAIIGPSDTHSSVVGPSVDHSAVAGAVVTDEHGLGYGHEGHALSHAIVIADTDAVQYDTHGAHGYDHDHGHW